MQRPWFDVRHYINGEFTGDGDGFEVFYPATNEPIGAAPEAREAEVDAAVGAAREAFGKWGKMPAAERRKVLHAFADGIRAREDELARVESWDVARPMCENTHGYVLRVAANIEFFADFVLTHGSEAFPMDNGYVNYVLHQPTGVAALITPWNVPMMLETWKIGPALAFGNTVVLKPAELTPVGAWKLAHIAHEAGVPPGVFNVVHGFGPDSAGEYLTAHPDVDLISFTGETTTGKAIMRAASDGLKKLSFEMGGKGPNVIFADADPDRAAEISLKYVSRQQVSKELEARGLKTPYLDIFQFCNPEDARQMILHDPIYAAYMPCRIAMVEDKDGQLWLMMLNLDMLINSQLLPPELTEIAIRVNQAMLDVMVAGATGEF